MLTRVESILQTGELIYNVALHELGNPITDLQWSPDRTYFITASKDKTAKVSSCSLENPNRSIVSKEREKERKQAH